MVRIPSAASLADIAVDLATGAGRLIREHRSDHYVIDTKSTPSDMVTDVGPRDVPLQRAVVGTGFAYDADVRARQGAVVAALLPRLADIRRCGSAALDLCATAAGRLDAYFEAGLNPWDWSAGVLVAGEAGCVTGGLRGRVPATRMTAVAGPRLAADFFALLEEVDADGVGAA